MSKESAEDKLKKLLAASAAAQAEVDPTQAEVARQMAEAVRGKSWVDHLPPFLREILPISQSPSGTPVIKLGLNHINQILRLVALFVLIWLGAVFLNGFQELKRESSVAMAKVFSQSTDKIIPAVDSLSVYLRQMGRRNIFQPFERKVAESSSGQGASVQRLSGFAQKLKLLGISWTNSPETALAMLENKDNKMAYFVRRGEKVEHYTVRSIYADRVVLTNQDEEITIKYEIEQK